MIYRLKELKGDTIAVPQLVFSKLGIAEEYNVRVALYVLATGVTDPEKICADLKLRSRISAESALSFWAGAGLLEKYEENAAPGEEPSAPAPMTWGEITAASRTDPMISSLIDCAQEYLPAPSNIRLADLMKEHNISQPELAKEIGCSKSTISRFISGAKGTLTHEQVLKIARLFNVSTDFLLGETNIPDRKNYDIAELGLSVEAAKNLYTGRVNTEVVNLLLENARFAELTYRIAQYFDDTFASGIAAQNAMLSTLSNLLRTKVKTPEAAKAAKDISLRRKPVYQGDLDDIEMYFMAAVKEIKKGIGSHYAEQEAMSKKVAEKMFTELTKGQDVQHPTITAEQLADAMLDSVSGMEGATPEALEQLRSGLLGILQSAAEQENAHEADE